MQRECCWSLVKMESYWFLRYNAMKQILHSKHRGHLFLGDSLEESVSLNLPSDQHSFQSYFIAQAIDAWYWNIIVLYCNAPAEFRRAYLLQILHTSDPL